MAPKRNYTKRERYTSRFQLMLTPAQMTELEEEAARLGITLAATVRGRLFPVGKAIEISFARQQEIAGALFSRAAV